MVRGRTRKPTKLKLMEANPGMKRADRDHLIPRYEGDTYEVPGWLFIGTSDPRLYDTSAYIPDCAVFVRCSISSAIRPTGH